MAAPTLKSQAWARTWPFHVRLLALVTGLIFLTAAGVGLATYGTTRAEVQRLSKDLMAREAEKAMVKTRDLMSQSRETLELARTLLQEDPAAAVTRDRPPDAAAVRARLRLCLQVLRSSPRLVMVNYGDRHAHFHSAFRWAEGDIRLDHRWLEQGRNARTVLRAEAGGAWKPAPTGVVLRRRYDCRERPWYRAAADRGSAAWTPPYTLFGSGRPAISVSAPVSLAGGGLAGVCSVSMELEELGRFVEALRPGRNGRVYLLSEDLRLVAPFGVTVTREGAETGENRSLPLAAEYRDPVLRAAAAELGAERLPGAARQFLCTVGGARHLAALYPFHVEDGPPMGVLVVEPEAEVLAGLRHVPYWILGWCGAVLLATYGLSWVLALQVTRPLRSIARQLDAVSRFELALPAMPPSRILEVDGMLQAVEQMKASLRSFARYVPADLVRRLLLSGQEARPGGETVRVTILFADIVGFSGAGERMAAAELVEALSRFLGQMEAVVEAHRGLVVQYVGDCVVALWNAPIRPCDEPEARACAAALAYGGQAGTGERAALEARVGIHTGEVVVGNIGSPERLSYTAIGDAVNVASRVEGLTRLYRVRVLVSESTREAAAGYEFREVDQVAVKGRRAGIRLYEPLGERGTVDPARAEVCRHYAEGLAHYRRRDFAAARLCFLRALEADPRDGPADVLRGRCELYLEDPPPPWWEGVFTAETK